MRTLISTLLVLVALVLAAVAGPATWLQRNIVEQAGFVQLAAPLGSDAQFQSRLATTAGNAAVKDLQLPDPLNNLVAAFIAKAAGSLQQNAEYPQTWNETLGKSHDLTFAASDKDGANAKVAVDMTPMVTLLTKNLGEAVGITVPAAKDTVISFEQKKVATALPVIKTAGGLSTPLAIGALLALVLAVAVGRRRGATVLGFGIGLAVVGLLWQIAAGIAVNRVPTMVGEDDAVIGFARDLTERGADSWQAWVNGCYVLAGVLIVVAVVALIVGRRRTT